MTAATWAEHAAALFEQPAIPPARQAWLDAARPEQLPPPGGSWAYIGGRGTGKTRSGAEALADDLQAIPACRAAIIARTFDDGRDVCVEGESGLLAVLDRYGLRPGHGLTWNRSLGELVLDTGSRADLYTSEKPDQLRGPQHHVAWCDEVGAWIKAADTWDMMEMGLRLGTAPRWYVTTTPRPTPTVRLVMADADKTSRGSTYDNAANLPARFLARMRAKYEGTRLGRQEIHAELLDDVPGALWLRRTIDDTRVVQIPYPGRLLTPVVGLDPSDASGEGAEFGLAVVGLGMDHELYVVQSEGLVDGPVESLRAAVTVARRWGARIVIEKNHGSAYLIATLEQVLREEGVRVPYQAVSASDGKRTRAEPVAALYEQRRVHHVGLFGELEDQQCSWTGTGPSPDRLDALVWAISEFLGYSLAPPAGESDGLAVPYGATTGLDPTDAAIPYN